MNAPKSAVPPEPAPPKRSAGAERSGVRRARSTKALGTIAEPPVADAGPAPARAGFFRRLSPLGRVIGGLVAAVSFVTGIIAVVPILTRDATNFDSLRLESSPLAGDLEYAVPAAADFSGFPQGAAGVCDPAQQAWLEANGQPITTAYLVDVRNVASEGPMLALTRLRGIGESGSEPALVKVVCSPTGASAVGLQAARLLVSDAAQIAYFDKSAFGQTAEGIPDSPVAWNLAPGETGQFALSLFPTQSFAGRLDFTVISGTDQRDFVVVEEISLPGLVRGGLSYLVVDGGLACIRIDGAERTACEVGELING